MAWIDVQLSDRAKSIIYFVLMLGYLMAVAVLWTRVLEGWIATWPQQLSAILFVFLSAPGLALGSASIRYRAKATGEDLNRSPADEYAKLWRGEQSLGKSWGFCLISTFLLVAAGETLVTFLRHPPTVNAVVMYSLGFVVAFGLHVVATRGIWGSAKRYAGAKIWANLARGGVIASYAALVFILGQLAYYGFGS